MIIALCLIVLAVLVSILAFKLKSLNSRIKEHAHSLELLGDRVLLLESEFNVGDRCLLNTYAFEDDPIEVEVVRKRIGIVTRGYSVTGITSSADKGVIYTIKPVDNCGSYRFPQERDLESGEWLSKKP